MFQQVGHAIAVGGHVVELGAEDGEAGEDCVLGELLLQERGRGFQEELDEGEERFEGANVGLDGEGGRRELAR